MHPPRFLLPQVLLMLLLGWMTQRQQGLMLLLLINVPAGSKRWAMVVLAAAAGQVQRQMERMTLLSPLAPCLTAGLAPGLQAQVQLAWVLGWAWDRVALAVAVALVVLELLMLLSMSTGRWLCDTCAVS